MRTSDVDDGATRISGWFKPDQQMHTRPHARSIISFQVGTLDAAMTI